MAAAKTENHPVLVGVHPVSAICVDPAAVQSR